MATLHEVTDLTKKILLFTTIAIIGMLVIYFGYQGFLYVKEILYPTPPIPPNTIFGKLPKVNFPESKFKKDHTYLLDTVTGSLPVFKNEAGEVIIRIPVHEFEEHELSLLDLQTTKNSVANTGFKQGGFKLEDDIYRFISNDKNLSKTIDINIISKNFTISSDYLSQSSDNISALPPKSESLNETTLEYLSKMGINLDDLDLEKTRFQFFKIEEEKHVPVEDEFEAQVIRIDLMQKDVSGLSIYYPQATTSLINFVVAGPPSKPEIIAGNLIHKKIKESKATYPLKDINKAYEELLNGNAYISHDFTSSKQVKIKEVLLGYLIYDKDQKYLMPIYIFKGLEDEFYAYVSAIDDSWIEGMESTQE